MSGLESKFYRDTLQELEERFGVGFLEKENNIQKDITAKDIVHLSGDEVDAIQVEYDKENCREILNSYANGEINEVETQYLLNYYKDGMACLS